MNDGEVVGYIIVLLICIVLFLIITWLITRNRTTPVPPPEPGWVEGTTGECLTYNFPYNFLTSNSQASFNILDNLTGTSQSCYDTDMISAQTTLLTCSGITGNSCFGPDNELVSYGSTGSIYTSCSSPCEGDLSSLFLGYTEGNMDMYLAGVTMDNTDYYQFRVSYTGPNNLLTKIEDRATGLCLDISNSVETLTLNNMNNFPECSGVTGTIQGYGVTLAECNPGWNWYTVPSINVTGTSVNHQQLVYVKGLTPPTSLSSGLLNYLDTNAGAMYTDMNSGSVPIVSSRQNGCYANYAMYQPFTFNNRNSYGLEICDFPSGVTSDCVSV